MTNVFCQGKGGKEPMLRYCEIPFEVHPRLYFHSQVDCVDGAPQLCQRFNIQGYPTIKLFKYGQYVGDYVGQRDRSE